MREIEKIQKESKILSDEELEKVASGSDVESLKTSGKTVPLPEARYKKESEGGYAGNTDPNLPKL